MGGIFAVTAAFLFIGVANLTILNMLIGVLCDVVSAVADVEREEITFLNTRDKIQAVMKDLDTNNDNVISAAEFKMLAEKKTVWHLLKEINVDPDAFVDFGKQFFEDDREAILQFDDFMQMIMDMREDNQATVKSLHHIWMQVKSRLLKNYEEIQSLRSEADQVAGCVEKSFSK